MTRREFIQQLPEPYLTIANWEIDRLEKELGEAYTFYLQNESRHGMELELHFFISKWLPLSAISLSDWWAYVGLVFDQHRNYPPVHELYQTLIK